MNSSDKKLGLTFAFMGGHGQITCNDCGFTQELTSFTHGYHQSEKGMHKSSTSGFQCQNCGQLTTRKETNPFPESEFSSTLKGVPAEEKADIIEHMEFMKGLCESSMSETPDSPLYANWKAQVAHYKRELETVSPEELKVIHDTRAAHDKAYQESLKCDCGGKLEREQILFCPKCKSKNLSYDMGYIT